MSTFCQMTRGVRTNPCRTPLLSRRNLLRLPLPAVRMKLRLPTISIITRTMCLSGSNRSSLQVRPRCHAVLYAALGSTKLALNLKVVLDVQCQHDDLIYGRPPSSKTRLLQQEQWVDDWFDTGVDESLEDLEEDTQQRYT